MALKKLPKKKEFNIVDPVTFEVACAFNDCFQKFEPVIRTGLKTPQWNKYNPIKYHTYSHECKECGILYSDSDDTGKTANAYNHTARNGSLKLSSDENIKVLAQLQSYLKVTIDPEKRRDMQHAIDRINVKLSN